VIALSDGTTGAVGDKYTYSAYGESPSLAGNAFRYTGRRVDAETGLYYYRARYYSPRLGRFLQPDPIGYQGGLNLYAYVGGDPLNLTDPTGHSPSEVASSSNQLIPQQTASATIAGQVPQSYQTATATSAPPSVSSAGPGIQLVSLPTGTTPTQSTQATTPSDGSFQQADLRDWRDWAKIMYCIICWKRFPESPRPVPPPPPPISAPPNPGSS
jgi:RHS repeat-associated protein